MILKTDEYTNHPIFLHTINRELFDAVDRDVDRSAILSALCVFSVVSNQIIFCNASQIHEVFFQDDEALQEIDSLSKIGRFIAHSDYGSFAELRESRVEQFQHTLIRHPGFHKEPSKVLKQLPHGSMGFSPSTTNHIERQFRLWIEGDESSSLKSSLSQQDEGTLRRNETWLLRTLQERDQKALTFDAFERTAGGVILKAEEGAVRRSLTEAYIDSYLKAFDPICIWGFRGINQFERYRLLTGLNLGFAITVLTETGVNAHLKRSKNYGRVKRITSDQSQAAAFFREAYASLSACIDQTFDAHDAWHICDSKVRAATQKISSREMLKPTKESASYQDVLFRAGEALTSAQEKLASEFGVKGADPKIYALEGFRDKSRKSLLDSNEDLNLDTAGIGTAGQAKGFWQNYYALVLLASLLTWVSVFFSLPVILDITRGINIACATAAALVVGAITFWYHPDNWYRRVAFFGLALCGLSSIEYQIHLSGELFGTTDSLDFSNKSSKFMLVVGALFGVSGIFADLIYRIRKK